MGWAYKKNVIDENVKYDKKERNGIGDTPIKVSSLGKYDKKERKV